MTTSDGPHVCSRCEAPAEKDVPVVPLHIELRDYFAAKALQSVIMVCAHDTREPEQTLEQYFAKFSYELADAMLKAREVKNV